MYFMSTKTIQKKVATFNNAEKNYFDSILKGFAFRKLCRENPCYYLFNINLEKHSKNELYIDSGSVKLFIEIPDCFFKNY